MDRPLKGRVILIVDEEPLIALDIECALQDAGATTVVACSRAAVLQAIETPGLCAAILDQVPGEDTHELICLRLKERSVPYLIHNGFSRAPADHISKPASPAVLVAAMTYLLERRSQLL
jgi:DNA-binding response OmpR family regulator